jgi:hypothetical protein
LLTLFLFLLVARASLTLRLLLLHQDKRREEQTKVTGKNCSFLPFYPVAAC